VWLLLQRLWRLVQQQLQEWWLARQQWHLEQLRLQQQHSVPVA
jgi:hypothetical protein